MLEELGMYPILADPGQTARDGRLYSIWTGLLLRPKKTKASTLQLVAISSKESSGWFVVIRLLRPFLGKHNSWGVTRCNGARSLGSGD